MSPFALSKALPIWAICGASSTKGKREKNSEYGSRPPLAFGVLAGVRDTGIKAALYSRVFFVALGLVGAMGAAAIYGIGAHLVVSGGISAGTLVAMAAFVQRIYQPLTGLTNARIEVITAFVSFDRVFEVLDAPVAIFDRPGAVYLVGPRGEVEFDNVVFRYPPASASSVASLEAPGTTSSDPDVDVLKGLSLKIASGETIASVGSSGSGKSILLQNMIIDIYHKLFERIYIFSPSIDVDMQTWLPVKKYIKNELKLEETDDEQFYYNEYDSEALSKIIDTQRKMIEYQQKGKL